MAKKNKVQAVTPQVEAAPVVSEPESAFATQGPVPQMEGQAVSVTGPMPPMMDQLGGAWEGLLAMATAQGATRADIIGMTLHTAKSIVEMTALALWPLGSEVEPGEAKAFALTQAALHGLTEAENGYQG